VKGRAYRVLLPLTHVRGSVVYVRGSVVSSAFRGYNCYQIRRGEQMRVTTAFFILLLIAGAFILGAAIFLTVNAQRKERL
jgi:hypothetical protein